MWNSLRFRLTAILIGLAIGPLILVGSILGQRTYTAVREQTLSFQVQVAQSVSLEVEKQIQNVTTDLNSLGDEIGRLNKPDRAQWLSLMLNAISSGAYQNNYNELILLNNQGQEQVRVSHNEIISSNKLSNRSTADEFTKPAANRETYYSPVRFDPSTGNVYMIIAIPLYEPRSVKLLGVLVADLRFSAIGDVIASVPVGAGQTIYITNPAGELVAHQDHSVKLQGAKIALPSQAGLQSGLNGTDVALGIHKIQFGNQEFSVVAERPASEAMALANNTITTLVIILLAALLAAIFFVFLSVRQIVFPIEGLAATAKLIAAGDLSQKAAARSKDEIGVLANAFNGMTSQLRTLINTLELRVADRTKALATSSEISRRLSTILNRKELVTEVVNQVKNAFGYYHTQIYFYDEANENLVMAGGTGEAGEMMLAQFHKIQKGRGLVGRAAETNEAVLVSDTSQNPDWLPNSWLPDTKSEAAIPISIGDDVLGVLDVQHNITDGLRQENVDSLQSIANQVAVATQNIRQYENSRKIAADMSVVANVGIATSTITDIDRLLKEVVDLSKKSFDLYHAHIYLLNEAGDLLELASGAGEVGRQMVSEKRTIPMDSEKSLVARSARTQQGVVVNDVTAAPDFLPHPLLPETRAEMAVPMVVSGKVIGVLDVQSEIANRFTEVDINIQTTLASQIAVAVQNARNFLKSQRQAERETAVNLITQKIQNATTIEAALQIAARELGHALGMKSTLVALDPEVLAGEQKGN